jgi:hypothetical protein
LRIDPSGKFLYTFGDSNLAGFTPFDEVVRFAIDPTTGDLTPLPGFPLPITTDLAQGFDMVVTR